MAAHYHWVEPSPDRASYRAVHVYMRGARKCHGSGTIPHAGEPRSRKSQDPKPMVRTPGFRFESGEQGCSIQRLSGTIDQVSPPGNLGL
jgi:hypothetical protein